MRTTLTERLVEDVSLQLLLAFFEVISFIFHLFKLFQKDQLLMEVLASFVLFIAIGARTDAPPKVTSHEIVHFHVVNEFDAISLEQLTAFVSDVGL